MIPKLVSASKCIRHGSNAISDFENSSTRHNCTVLPLHARIALLQIVDPWFIEECTLLFSLYILALALSTATVGLFGHRSLTELGYAPNLDVGLYVALTVAGAYAAVQLLYMAVLQTIAPTRSKGLFLAEIVSLLSALILVPHLIDMPLPGLDGRLAGFLPLVYLAGFGVVHCFFKLMSFFAALCGAPAGRLAVLGWLVAATLCAGGSYGAAREALGRFESLRPVAPAEQANYRIGYANARACELAEGSILSRPLIPYQDQCLTLRWANVPGGDAERIDRVYVEVVFDGSEQKRYINSVSLDDGGWGTMRITSEYIPEDVKGCTIVWSRERMPAWQKLIGFRPIKTSGARVLLSGPFQHRQRQATTPPNFVVVAIDGLAADHLSCFGYDRKTTPDLDRFAYRALAFENTYTAVPEVTGATMTMLTGLNPLRHQYLDGHRPANPEELVTLAEMLRDEKYTTAAFTEGESKLGNDLYFGSGVEQGFEFFDSQYQDYDGDNPAGSALTVARAEEWIKVNEDVHFFLFVRLRELGRPALREQYGREFITSESNPPPRDVYDTALNYMDGQVGALIKFIRDYETRRNTCVVVTSPFGLDFSRGPQRWPQVGLTDPSLRVPLLIYSPDSEKVERSDLIGLEDLAPTLLNRAGAQIPVDLDGHDFWPGPTGASPVSMFGSPLALSIRDRRWRYSWQSGIYPFSDKSPERPGTIGLYDVRGRASEVNMSGRYSSVASDYADRLEAYLERNLNRP